MHIHLDRYVSLLCMLARIDISHLILPPEYGIDLLYDRARRVADGWNIIRVLGFVHL